MEGSSPLLQLESIGDVGSEYHATEIFGEEVATLVNTDSVYRETVYSVAIPYSNSLRDKVLDHLTKRDLCTVDPWVFLRERILVSLFS